ncbi:hypothetical protein DdX_16716 [Ditylenchus destructor]|uniref:Uncharacterized protein n=1 Tax=Ditylenchus destructor TaxID=166010 RepID=A0AAD4MQD3_9BILA|nr:hypothetical protein DdX_16716 [Ditylenchus destructor]
MYWISKRSALFFLALIITTLHPSVSPVTKGQSGTPDQNKSPATGQTQTVVEPSQGEITDELDNGDLEEYVTKIDAVLKIDCNKAHNQKNQELCREILEFAGSLKADLVSLQSGTQTTVNFDHIKPRFCSILGKIINAHTADLEAKAEIKTESKPGNRFKAAILAITEKIEKNHVSESDAIAFLHNMKDMYEKGAEHDDAQTRTKRGTKLKIVGFAAAITAKMSFGSLWNCIKHPIGCFFGTIILAIIIGVCGVVLAGVTVYSLVEMHKNGGIRNNLKELIHEFKEMKAKAKEAKNELRAELNGMQGGPGL